MTGCWRSRGWLWDLMDNTGWTWEPTRFPSSSASRSWCLWLPSGQLCKTHFANLSLCVAGLCVIMKEFVCMPLSFHCVTFLPITESSHELRNPRQRPGFFVVLFSWGIPALQTTAMSVTAKLTGLQDSYLTVVPLQITSNFTKVRRPVLKPINEIM